MSRLVGNKLSSEGQRRSKGMRKTSNLPKNQQNTEKNRRNAAAVNLERDSQDTSCMDKEVSGVVANKVKQRASLVI